MKSKILQIWNTKGKTAYNPTIPFNDAGTIYMGVRIESLDSELDSRTRFARRLSDDIWEIDDSLPSFPLQDPAYMRINGELVITGVRIADNGKGIVWSQEFYRGDSIRGLEYIASGPVGMKDIRLVDLNGKVGVFTRPQGKIGGLGKIGYLEIGRIDELARFRENDWYSAKLLDGLFEEETWGGANQAVMLTNSEIGVIGHNAYEETVNGELVKHYYAVSFRFDTKRKHTSNIRTIARKADFPSSPSKRSPELTDVVFPAGIDENFNLYCGLSDYCIGVKQIQNPFKN